ncbi:hypothetical protein BRD06_09585 [Halobacteriales archaeon QS_9_67_15]|nr:MAG: hypothetical protein BRD06_09585 [Halobacteriales archaeon QS_9_67_15]
MMPSHSATVWASLLYLSPVPAGGTATDAFANTIEAARQAERLGDKRARPESPRWRRLRQYLRVVR